MHRSRQQSAGGGPSFGSQLLGQIVNVGLGAAKEGEERANLSDPDGFWKRYCSSPDWNASLFCEMGRGRLLPRLLMGMRFVPTPDNPKNNVLLRAFSALDDIITKLTQEETRQKVDSAKGFAKSFAKTAGISSGYQASGIPKLIGILKEGKPVGWQQLSTLTSKLGWLLKNPFLRQLIASKLNNMGIALDGHTARTTKMQKLRLSSFADSCGKAGPNNLFCQMMAGSALARVILQGQFVLAESGDAHVLKHMIDGIAFGIRKAEEEVRKKIRGALSKTADKLFDWLKSMSTEAPWYQKLAIKIQRNVEPVDWKDFDDVAALLYNLLRGILFRSAPGVFGKVLALPGVKSIITDKIISQLRALGIELIDFVKEIPWSALTPAYQKALAKHVAKKCWGPTTIAKWEASHFMEGVSKDPDFWRHCTAALLHQSGKSVKAKQIMSRSVEMIDETLAPRKWFGRASWQSIYQNQLDIAKKSGTACKRKAT